MLGIVLASLSAVVSFTSIGAYPLWAIAVIAIDVLIIHGLTLRAPEHRRLRRGEPPRRGGRRHAPPDHAALRIEETDPDGCRRDRRDRDRPGNTSARPLPPRRSSPGSPGILEGALLVTVGLTTAAVEAVTRAVMTALGETLPPATSETSKRVERPRTPRPRPRR